MERADLQEMLQQRWPVRAVDGIATTRMLADAGITDRALTAGIRSGIIRRLHRGSYIPAVMWNQASPWTRDSLVLTAHVLAAQGDGVYSHASAARLHGLTTWNCGPRIHLTQPYAIGRGSHSPDVSGHRQLLPAEQILPLRVGPALVRVTSMAQTVLDAARSLDTQRAVIIGDSALRRGVTAAALQTLLDTSPVVRGSARAQRTIALLDARSESAGESRTRVVMSAMDLPMPRLQLVVQTPDGEYRGDFGWEEVRLLMEFDGWGKYFDYRPTDVAIARERKREKALMESGWQVLRIHWEDLDDPRELEARIRAALERAAYAVRRRGLGRPA
ncbi:type IV toxin-antitoxin system AbiEi family antitoxin domain-containing protein [Specibacter sp. RAF43]|uniref:type IV toxin-antitoxin system AbiEi family antitoxin domain-containing protein n=1 Tax=Specibacter sp. RAF43 TaxID=3233057 RepID=UPI003F9E1E0D